MRIFLPSSATILYGTILTCVDIFTVFSYRTFRPSFPYLFCPKA